MKKQLIVVVTLINLGYTYSSVDVPVRTREQIAKEAAQAIEDVIESRKGKETGEVSPKTIGMPEFKRRRAVFEGKMAQEEKSKAQRQAKRAGTPRETVTQKIAELKQKAQAPAVSMQRIEEDASLGALTKVPAKEVPKRAAAAQQEQAQVQVQPTVNQASFPALAESIFKRRFDDLNNALTQFEKDTTLMLLLSDIKHLHQEKRDPALLKTLLADFTKLLNTVGSESRQKSLARDVEELLAVADKPAALFDSKNYPALSRQENLKRNLDKLSNALTQFDKDTALMLLLAGIKHVYQEKRDTALLKALLADFTKLAHTLASASGKQNLARTIEELQSTAAQPTVTVDIKNYPAMAKQESLNRNLQRLGSALTQIDKDTALVLLLADIKRLYQEKRDPILLKALAADFTSLVNAFASASRKQRFIGDIEELLSIVAKPTTFDMKNYPALAQQGSLKRNLQRLSSALTQIDKDTALVLLLADIKRLHREKRDAALLRSLLADFTALVNSVASSSRQKSFAQDIEQLRLAAEQPVGTLSVEAYPTFAQTTK